MLSVRLLLALAMQRITISSLLKFLFSNMGTTFSIISQITLQTNL